MEWMGSVNSDSYRDSSGVRFHQNELYTHRHHISQHAYNKQCVGSLPKICGCEV